jgi:hypothetical protein
MLRLILIVVIGVLALSYLGISLRGIVDSPAGQENIAFVWQLLQEFWNWLVNILRHMSLEDIKGYTPTTHFTVQQ